ncbi:hypothetical protein B0O80DRAFT_525379 [Mortierella sp. GBAus27b]|nr:hypothetical protein B0O80DRAFT_525379 [Mortierella sp. GBAus27b]
MLAYTNDSHRTLGEGSNPSPAIKEVQIHDPQHTLSHRESLPGASSSSESVSEVGFLNNFARTDPSKSSPILPTKATSAYTPTQSPFESIGCTADTSTVFTRHPSSCYLSPIRDKQEQDTAAGSRVTLHHSRAEPCTSNERNPSQLLSSTDDKFTQASLEEPIAGNAIIKAAELATPLPSLTPLRNPQISLRGYTSFDPQPWENTIAEHQAKTIQNFHAITRSLDNINAELQFIFSEFLTRQYEHIDEALKTGHRHILQQEQEQDRLQAQMVSFVNAMKHAYQLLAA